MGKKAKGKPAAGEVDLGSDFLNNGLGGDFGDLPDFGGSLDAIDLPGGLDAEDEAAGDSEGEQDLAEETKGELAEVKSAFQKRAARVTERFFEALDSEFWVAFCFQTRAQKEEFLRKTKLTADEFGDKYVDGLKAAKKLGVAITSPSPTWRPPKKSKRLAGLT